MADFIGHGILSCYSREFEFSKPTKLGVLIADLNLPEDLRENLIAVRDKVLVDDAELISGSDTVHLFIAPHGG